MPKVARFIAAVSQDSTVQLTAEGKLPELSLAEATAKKPKTSESNTSPLVLGLVLCVSTLASILLLVADFKGSGSDETSVQQARESIAGYYTSYSGKLLPYQVLLREAQRAADRRDFAAEKDAYRRVRDLLLSESKDPYAGVTGTQSGDEELARLLAIMLDAESR